MVSLVSRDQSSGQSDSQKKTIEIFVSRIFSLCNRPTCISCLCGYSSMPYLWRKRDTTALTRSLYIVFKIATQTALWSSLPRYALVIATIDESLGQFHIWKQWSISMPLLLMTRSSDASVNFHWECWGTLEPNSRNEVQIMYTQMCQTPKFVCLLQFLLIRSLFFLRLTSYLSSWAPTHMLRALDFHSLDHALAKRTWSGKGWPQGHPLPHRTVPVKATDMPFVIRLFLNVRGGSLHPKDAV